VHRNDEKAFGTGEVLGAACMPSDGNSQDLIQYRVMIVDDDVELLTAIGSLVASWGHTVVPFNKFDDARDRLLAGVDADTMLVDVRIGSFNGLHLIHLARKLNPGMTVIAMTGFDDPVLRAEAEKVGATFLLKPVAPQELQKRLFRV
jgi:DNA-binding NtrC family response regulator